MQLRKIGIDAGHGGPDTDDGRSFAGGCAMVPGFSEDDWSLRFGRLLGDRLQTFGFQVAHSRTTDVLLSREQRRDKLIGRDLILSLHVNTIVNSPRASGLITFRWPGNRLSFAACQQIHRFAPPELRRTSRRDFSVSRQDWTHRAHRVVTTWTAESVVLLECGFASNVRDLQYLMSGDGQDALADGITAAMVALKGEIAGGNVA